MNSRLRRSRLATERWIDGHERGVGAAAIGLIVFGLYAVFVGLPFIGGPSGKTVRAEFDTSTALTGAYQLAPDRQLIKGAPVRVHGVEVGVVTKTRSVADGRATRIEMKVDDVTIHEDARARIAFRTLLGGNLQIQIDPGSASAPALGDDVIPPSRTSDQVAFDDLFDPFNSGTRAASRQTFKGLADGLSHPAAVGRAIDALGPSAQTLQRGLEPLLGTRDGDLADLVRNGARTVRALNADTPALSALVRQADATLGVTDARRGELATFLAESPSALRATDAAVAQIAPTLDALDPLVERLRPGVRALEPAVRKATPALREADRFLDQARPLLGDVGPTFKALHSAAHSGVPLVRRLSPVVDYLNDKTLPFLDRVDPDRKLKVYEAIGPFFGAAASAASQFDSEGYFFYFPDEPTLRSLGASPCAPDLSALQETQCESLLNVLGRIFQGPGARKP